MATVTLDYAPPRERALRRLFRMALAPLAVASVALVAGILAYVLTPPTYLSTTIYNLYLTAPLTLPSFSLTSKEDNDRAFADHEAAMRSPPAYDAILADLAARGHSLPAGEEGRQLLARRLIIRPMADRSLVSVSFESRDLTLSSAVVSAATRVAESAAAESPQPMGFATVTRSTTSVDRSSVPAVISAVAGGLAAIVVLAWRRSASTTLSPQ